MSKRQLEQPSMEPGWLLDPERGLEHEPAPLPHVSLRMESERSMCRLVMESSGLPSAAGAMVVAGAALGVSVSLGALQLDPALLSRLPRPACCALSLDPVLGCLFTSLLVVHSQLGAVALALSWFVVLGTRLACLLLSAQPRNRARKFVMPIIQPPPRTYSSIVTKYERLPTTFENLQFPSCLQIYLEFFIPKATAAVLATCALLVLAMRVA